MLFVQAFLVTGDVYRRDAIDVTHFPVFHQMEGVRLFTAAELAVRSPRLRDGRGEESASPLSEAERHAEGVRIVESDLKQALAGLVRSLFGPDTLTRWVDAYFPFTTPSFELEVFFNSKWLEVLGCGVIHPQILRNCGYTHGEIGWAFGLGLERLALVLFDIPDIRLFWSKGTTRFLSLSLSLLSLCVCVCVLSHTPLPHSLSPLTLRRLTYPYAHLSLSIEYIILYTVYHHIQSFC
jgi:phenylalanyl-tRNA synthetase alpha chain